MNWGDDQGVNQVWELLSPLTEAREVDQSAQVGDPLNLVLVEQQLCDLCGEVWTEVWTAGVD